MTGQPQAVKVELKGKTRKLVEMHAQPMAEFDDSSAVMQALDKDKTNVVITNEGQINDLQELLEEIKTDPDYNGHMDGYNKRVSKELEAAKTRFW